MGVTLVFTMRRAVHAAVIQPPGVRGLLVICGSDRSDASGPGGVRLPRPAGVHCSAGVGQSVPAWVSWEGIVPLSEHERRQLEQIEAALRAGDPRFAEAVRAADRGCITGAG